MNIKFTAIRESILVLKAKIEEMPQNTLKSSDFTDIKASLSSLHTVVTSIRGVDEIASSIKETSQRQDQSFRQLSEKMEAVRQAVKSKTEQKTDTDEFGTLLPPPK